MILINSSHDRGNLADEFVVFVVDDGEICFSCLVRIQPVIALRSLDLDSLSLELCAGLDEHLLLEEFLGLVDRGFESVLDLGEFLDILFEFVELPQLLFRETELRLVEVPDPVDLFGEVNFQASDKVSGSLLDDVLVLLLFLLGFSVLLGSLDLLLLCCGLPVVRPLFVLLGLLGGFLFTGLGILGLLRLGFFLAGSVFLTSSSLLF